ncbi:bifunctional folylpolyglutamate synthase/dihydrofolate synthase [Bacteroidetes bacterium endosymbiont of Geopemphigus sp.]|uniref:bifunctional folylpolyglutamate synthase/dihydrofolate synthase n=2 Tax=Bacteroidetes bacterium endosymbiont of Geopemphigus sp. TaxID=2047937 RepID=UPI002AD44C59|nr:folylpolyglutamate synthase/dihydrofolate synthase family protein [Bacteroidetes bacterium endosymbiont of Geopemphigus sp.]
MDHLPMYQKQGMPAYKPGLDRILKFCEYLGNPQNSFASIHIAGTNGKGSTAHMLASILQESGYCVGLFSSPHLKDFRERICCNGVMISKKFVSDFVSRHYKFMKVNALSFFEMTTAMAFDNFRARKVDIAFIETGLGGRLDSTNIILPELSVITNIGRDHTGFLGSTLKQIALEKAGIIKNDTPVVIGSWIPETRAVFEAVAGECSAPVYFAKEPLAESIYPLPLKGRYQRFNEQTALKVVEVLRKKSWKISSKSLTNGLSNVIKNTALRGRWELLSHSPLIICDTAHNEDGIRIVAEQLAEEPLKQLRLVLGFVRGKEIEKMLSFFPENAIYYFCQSSLDRSFPIEELRELTQDLYESVYYFDSVKKAIAQAKKDAHQRDLIFVGGSTFVVADIL